MKHQTKCALTILAVALSPFILYYGLTTIFQAGAYAFGAASNFEMALFGFSTTATGEQSVVNTQLVQFAASKYSSYHYTMPAVSAVDDLSDSQISSLLAGHEIVTWDYAIYPESVTSLGSVAHPYCKYDESWLGYVPTENTTELCIEFTSTSVTNNPPVLLSKPTWQLSVTTYKSNINSTLLCVSLNIIIIIASYLTVKGTYLMIIRRRKH